MDPRRMILPPAWLHWLEAEDAHRRRKHLHRRRPTRNTVPDRRNFVSNDYLGLSRHPRVSAAARNALERWGAGSGGSALLDGHIPLHRRLEQELAAFLGAEDALLFPSGWQANQAAVTALAPAAPHVILSMDDNHASLVDGCRLSRAPRRLLPRRHPEAWEVPAEGLPLVVAESLHSMDGDPADWPALRSFARRAGAVLLLDEAHAVGAWGPGGRGLAGENGDAGLVRTVTFGKALGAQGAALVGSRLLLTQVLNTGRAQIFTTALAPAAAAAALASLRLLPALEDERRRLRGLSSLLRRELARGGLEIPLEPATPIVPVRVGGEEATLALARRLRRRGFRVLPVRPPTVPPGTCRLRLSLGLRHDEEAVVELARALLEAFPHAA